MRRRTFDALATAAGLFLVVVLVVAGVLLTWGYSFSSSTVHNQLAKQEIFFPPKAAFAHPKAGTEITPSMIPVVSQYAGQQVLNGAQAEVYADNFIAVHLSEMPYRGVYATIATMARAAKPGSPKATSLAALEQVSFQGTTLRSMLLEAYGFWQFGQIALIAAICSYIAAGLMLLLSIFGLVHLRRTAPEKEVLQKLSTRPHAATV
jgi:hypothetical protein